MHWFHKGHEGVRWPFEQPSVRSMQGEMKTVTFTLVCAPGQEGPLWKVTLSAFSLCEHTLHSSCGRNGPLFITEQLSDTHTLWLRWKNINQHSHTFRNQPFWKWNSSKLIHINPGVLCTEWNLHICSVVCSNQNVWQFLIIYNDIWRPEIWQ